MTDSPNKRLVRTYLDGFRTNDHAKILSCLADDIGWTVFGHFHLTGKQAYDEAVDGPGFVGPPRLDVRGRVRRRPGRVGRRAVRLR